MMNIETKYVVRRGKNIPIRIVYNGESYTVYDVMRAKAKSKRYFSMKDVEKDYKFLAE
jgi:hypothetical protein